MIRYIRWIPILVLICTQTNIGNAAGGPTFCSDGSGGDGSGPSAFRSMSYLDTEFGLIAGITLDFRDMELTGYAGGQDQPSTGTVNVEGNGATVSITGNRWQGVDFYYAVTDNTILEFTFESSTEAEIHGIGFDNDNSLSSDWLFQIYGTQNWGIRDYDYQGGKQTFAIPVGNHFTGSFTRLIFASDDDARVGASAKYSNIRIYERPALNFPNPPVTGMSLWLDASNTTSIGMSGTSVTTWRDKSGNGRNATAVGDPSYQTGFGGNKIIRLDGNDYFNLDLDFLANQSHSAFIVTKSEKESYNYLYGAATGGQGNRSLHVGYRSGKSLALNYWGHGCYPTINHGQHTAEGNTLNYVWPKGGNKQMYVNGYMQSTANCPGNPGGIIGAMAGGGRIGYVVGQTYQGEIAEIIMYTRVLSAAEREATEEYLAAKWGLTPIPILNFLNLSLGLTGYAGSQDQPSTGTVNVENNGATVSITGNRWQGVDFNYTVTPNTILEYTFESSTQAEIHGIGFDNNNDLSSDWLFQVYGTQNWANRDYNYQGGNQTFVIPVGQHFTGSFTRLFFASDDDAGVGGSAKYSNIRIYERP